MLIFPPEQGDEEFYCTGKAEPIDDPRVRACGVTRYHRHPHDSERLFELKLERVLHTCWENWATPASRPRRTVWRAAGAEARSSRPHQHQAPRSARTASKVSGGKTRQRKGQ